MDQVAVAMEAAVAVMEPEMEAEPAQEPKTEAAVAVEQTGGKTDDADKKGTTGGSGTDIGSENNAAGRNDSGSGTSNGSGGETNDADKKDTTGESGTDTGTGGKTDDADKKVTAARPQRMALILHRHLLER